MEIQLNIVLVEPRIPQNTGNIGRTCSATGANLHLVHPLGFNVDDKSLKRAGLDYWSELNVFHYDSLEDFLSTHKENLYYITTKAKNIYSDVIYPKKAFFLFGREDKGLPEDLLRSNMSRCVRLPMVENSRSLNLSNATTVIAYEFLRQHDFSGLKKTGEI